MEEDLYGSRNGSRERSSKDTANRDSLSNPIEKEASSTSYINTRQHGTKSSERELHMNWVHTIAEHSGSQSPYAMGITGENPPPEPMPTRSIVHLPNKYPITSHGNLYGVVVPPDEVLSMGSMRHYNFESFGKLDNGSIINDQNELNESINNLVKSEVSVGCRRGVNNVDNVYSSHQSPSLATNQGQKESVYCVICQKYVKNTEELQQHIYMDHPDQASISFLGESSNLTNSLPVCPSCKIELRKINNYENEYHMHGVQDDDQNMNLVPNSGIFMVCDQCGKEFTLGLAPDPSIQHNCSEPSKRHFCEHCDKSYKHSRDLRKHLKTQHGYAETLSHIGHQKTINKSNTEVSGTNSNSEPQPQANKVSCPNCKKTFRGPFELRRHILTVHENKRPYKCQNCHKVFRDAYELKRHSVSHERQQYQSISVGRFPPECMASADVLRLHNIEGHVGVIGGTEMGQCIGPEVTRDVYSSEPGSSFPNNTGNIDNWCGACDKNFRGSNEYKRHCTVVHEKKYRYKCIHCGKLWRDQYDLKRHCRRSHYIDREIDRAFIRKCLIDTSHQPNNINSALHQLPVSSLPSYDVPQDMPLILNHEAAAAIFGVSSDRNIRSVGNHLDYTFNVDHEHNISMARTSPNNSIFQNLPSMQSATMMYHSQTDPSSHLMETTNQPGNNEDINEDATHAIIWSNFESDLEVKKTDYS